MKNIKNNLLIASLLLTIVSNSYSLTDVQRKFISIFPYTGSFARSTEEAITLVQNELKKLSQQGLGNLNFTFEVDDPRYYFDDPRPHHQGEQIKTYTILMYAYQYGYPEVGFFHYLLTLGLNPLLANKEGLTPLELAELDYEQLGGTQLKAIRDLFRDWIQHKEKRKIFKK